MSNWSDDYYAGSSDYPIVGEGVVLTAVGEAFEAARAEQAERLARAAALAAAESEEQHEYDAFPYFSEAYIAYKPDPRDVMPAPPNDYVGTGVGSLYDLPWCDGFDLEGWTVKEAC